MDRRNILLAAATVPLAVRIPITTQEMGWRPIATAPKDGTKVLLYVPATEGRKAHTDTGYWADYVSRDKGRIIFEYGKSREVDGYTHIDQGWKLPYYSSYFSKNHPDPTHWMPIPAPPESA